jgi:drug/metabolite transporter (DMT)-like permease
MWLGIGILLIAIALGAVGQLLLKSGVNALGEDVSPIYVLKSFIKSPSIMGGFVCYGISSLFYLVSLSKLDLSYAYPMIALSYVIVAILSYKYLGEGLPTLRIVGIFVIIAGVTMVAFSHEEGGSSEDIQPPQIAGEATQQPEGP